MIAALQDIDMHYHSLGRGHPILMLHGGYLDHRHMMAEMEPIFENQPGWQRIYVDLPGHGATRAPDHFRSMDDVLGALLGFVDQLLPGQRYAVVGMSSGGHLARGLVHRRAADLTGVMFNAAATVTDMAARTLPAPVTIREDADFADLVGDRLDQIRHMQPVRDARFAQWNARYFNPAWEQRQRPFSDDLWAPENYAFSFDLHPLAAPFAAPSLILCGRQDTIVGYRDAWPLIEDYPRATFAVLDWGGHMIEPARPDLFGALVVDWLERVKDRCRHENG